jgi:uncharacterized protein YndB with AHSA1/START domain
VLAADTRTSGTQAFLRLPGKGDDMPDILHRVGIRSTPEKVFKGISTIEGLKHWWTEDTTGSDAVGGILAFRFEGGGMDMKVMELRPGELVRWKCVAGPREWVDTEVTFRLRPEDDQVFVLFIHAGWKEPVEFMHHCSTKWAVFLLSLRDWLETGKGHPTPYDIKIHVGD